jgi:hypothetical protein
MMHDYLQYFRGIIEPAIYMLLLIRQQTLIIYLAFFIPLYLLDFFQKKQFPHIIYVIASLLGGILAFIIAYIQRLGIFSDKLLMITLVGISTSSLLLLFLITSIVLRKFTALNKKPWVIILTILILLIMFFSDVWGCHYAWDNYHCHGFFEQSHFH